MLISQDDKSKIFVFYRDQPTLNHSEIKRQIVVRKINGVPGTLNNVNVSRTLVSIPSNIVTTQTAAQIKLPPKATQPQPVQKAQRQTTVPSSSFCVGLTDKEESPKTTQKVPATNTAIGKTSIQIRTPAALNQNYNQVLAAQRASPSSVVSGKATPPQLKNVSPAREY